MSSGRPININTKNPSYKPLPALPTENSNSGVKFTKSLSSSTSSPTSSPTSSLITVPIQGSSDLPLDSISLGHLRKILKQSLNNCALNIDPWESVILGIILDVAETIPKAIEALYGHEITKHRAIVSEKKINENHDEKDDHNNDNTSEKNQNLIKNESRFVITLKKDDRGKPTDSHFVYNYFDGEYLFKHENEEGNSKKKKSCLSIIF